MYEAIVVLPLLGSIIAGVIALIGARNRCPGESPPPLHDDHAAPPRASVRPIRGRLACAGGRDRAVGRRLACRRAHHLARFW